MIAARNRTSRRTIGAVIAAAAAAALAFPPTGRAEDPPAPPADPGAAVSQYRESIPGATGPILPGQGGRPGVRLQTEVEKRLSVEGGPDGPILRRIATSPEFGAPQQQAGPRGEGRTPGSTARAEGESSNAARAAATAVGHGGWRMLALGLFMVLTVASVLASGARGRQPAGPHG